MNLVVISWSFHYQSLMVKQQEQRYHPQKVWQYHGICCGNGWIMDTLLQRTQPRPIWHNGGIGSQLNLCHARIFIHWMSWRLSGYPDLPCFFPQTFGIPPAWCWFASDLKNLKFQLPRHKVCRRWWFRQNNMEHLPVHTLKWTPGPLVKHTGNRSQRFGIWLKLPRPSIDPKNRHKKQLNVGFPDAAKITPKKHTHTRHRRNATWRGRCCAGSAKSALLVGLNYTFEAVEKREGAYPNENFESWSMGDDGWCTLGLIFMVSQGEFLVPFGHLGEWFW